MARHSGARQLRFHVGTHDWERQQALIFPAKPIRSMTINALFAGIPERPGLTTSARMRWMATGFSMARFFSFQTRQPATSGRTLRVVAKDGLRTDDGCAGRYHTHVRPATRTVRAAAPGGFYVRDVARDGQPVAATWRRDAYHGTGVDFFSSPPGLGVRFYAKIVPDGDALSVDGELTDSHQHRPRRHCLFGASRCRGWLEMGPGYPTISPTRHALERAPT